MRQRNNHQNCMNVVSPLVCNYLTFLSKANEGETIPNLGCLCPFKVPGPTLLKYYDLIFIPFHIQELLSYQKAVKSIVGSPVFVVALAMGVSFVCLPAQRCACELTSDSVGRRGELRKDLFLTLP